MKRILQSQYSMNVEIIQRLGVGEEFTDELFLQVQLLAIRIFYNDPVSKRLCEARVPK